MNKLEELHEKASVSKSAEITTDIAVKYKDFWLKRDVEWFFGHGINTVYRKKNGKEITEKELFEEFINNHYDTNNR
jgi:hypothetical protein